MKKAHRLILAAFLAFVCIIVGMFIGRISTNSDIMIHNNNSELETSISNVTQSTVIDRSDIGKIAINTATSAQLQMLPNIGEVLASRIIEYRTQNGPFDAIEDLLLVEGIGEKRLEELRQYITLGG